MGGPYPSGCLIGALAVGGELRENPQIGNPYPSMCLIYTLAVDGESRENPRIGDPYPSVCLIDTLAGGSVNLKHVSEHEKIIVLTL
jgi:hypothetical protein